MGWLITLGILAVLAVLPLGVRIRYNEDGPLVRVVVGPVKLTVYPMASGTNKKEQKKKKEKDKSSSSASMEEDLDLPKPPQPPKKRKTPESGKGGSLLDFLPLVKLGIRLLGDFRRKLRVNDLQLKLILAGADPCDLAVNYGRTWAAVANLMPRLESWFVIKKRDVEVECDFAASDTLVYAYLDLTITLGRLLSLLLVYGVRALKEYLNIQKKRKGGAVT